jgi:hypothetical protein
MRLVVLPISVSISPFYGLYVPDYQALAFPIRSNANPAIDERTHYVLENWALLVHIAFRCWLFADDNPALVQIKSTNVGLALIGVGAAGSGSTLALTAIMCSLVCLTAIAVWAAGGLSPRPISIRNIPLPA